MNRDLLSISGLASLKASLRFLIIFCVFLVCTAIAAFGLVYLYKEYPTKFEQLAREETTKLDQLQTRQQAFILAKEYEKYIEEYEKLLVELKKKLPDTIGASNFLFDLHKNATDNNIYLSRRAPQTNKKHPSGFVEEIPIQIEGCASYHRIGDFVANLSNLERIITLDQFNMSNPELSSNQGINYSNLGVNINVPRQSRCDDLGGGYPFSATISTYKYLEDVEN